MKTAEKLLDENKVEIISNTERCKEARVAGTGVIHTVIIGGEKSRCTCTCLSSHKCKRRLRKHVLAVKRKLTN